MVVFSSLDFNKQGYKILTDGEELIVEPYDGTIKRYFCGRDYLIIEPEYKGETLCVITVDASECTIANISDKVEIVFHKESFVDSKQSSGGQSAQRFQHIRQEQLKQWCKEIADKIRLLYNKHKIILSGPGNTKTLVNHYMTKECQDNTLPLVDVGYTDLQGVYETLEKSKDTLKNVIYLENRSRVDEFLKLLSTNPSQVEYGPSLVPKNYRYILLTSKDIQLYGNNIYYVEDSRIKGFGICVVKK